MSEISYRICDICGKKIEPSILRYRVQEWSEFRSDIRPIYNDICRDCFDKIDETINGIKRESE